MFISKFTKISIVITIIIMLFLPAAVQGAGSEQQALNINKPLINILSETSEYIEIRVRFPENPIFTSSNGMIFDEKIYSHPSEVGVPDLPVLRESVKLPLGNDYTLEILNAESHPAQLGENGLPTTIPERALEIGKSNPLQTDETNEDVEPQKNDDAEDTELGVGEGDQAGDETVDNVDPQDGDAPQNVDQPQDGDDPQDADQPQEDDKPQETDESQTDDETHKNNEADFGESFPTSPAQLVQTYIMRGHNIGQFQLWPVAYYSGQQTVEIYEEITFRINIQQADVNLSAQRSSSTASPTFERLLSSQIINYSEGVSIQSDRTKSNEPILVITPDAFLGSLGALMNLKQNQGHPVTVAPLSTTGNTPESIKSYISNAYHNSASPPTYVILVGDVNNGANSMPAFIGLSSDSVTDLYYGTVDGNDWIPDIFVGRLPARNTTQLNTMINNLAAYNNLTGTESWVKKAAFLASNDSNFWHVAEGTQDYVINTHTQPSGYTGTFPTSPQAGGDKLYAHSYSAGNNEVVNAINNRRSLIAYTGHGSRSSWGGPSYSQSNIRNISHTGVLSVVTSFACITGDFNATESFGETWLLQQNKGAVTFIGSSASSFWGPDDTLERAMMDSLYSGHESAN